MNRSIDPQEGSHTWNKATGEQRSFWRELEAHRIAWCAALSAHVVSAGDARMDDRTMVLWVLAQVARHNLAAARATWECLSGWRKLPRRWTDGSE